MALLVAVGCKDDEEATTPEGGEGTAGGEQPGGTASGIESPPGSVQPEEEGEGEGWDGDRDTEGGEAGGEGAGAGGGEAGEGTAGGGGESGSAGGGKEEPSAESMWGATRAEQCKQRSRPTINGTAQNAIQAGVSAAKKGQIDSARRSFNQAISADQNAYPALYNLGVLADRQGNTSQAEQYYRRALSIVPDYAKALRGMVSIHLRQGSVPDAIALVAPLASRYEANKELQALHAEVLAKAERYDDAWEAARNALRCDERYVPAMISLVKASQKQGRDELAERVLDQALGIDDNNAELHYLKAKMLLEEDGRLREAMKELRRAVQIRSDYFDARMLLGVKMLEGANYQKAVEHLEAAAKLAPDMVAVHLNLGDAYRASEQWQKAKAEFEKALQMKSDLPEAHFNMGLMYMEAGEEFPGLDSLQAMQQAVEEFKKYRDMMGPRLPREDPSEAYLTNLNRLIDREKRRREREAQRAARQAEQAGGGEGGGGGQ
jgi:tetratricopeptide (TPR) repeat protein